MAAKVSFAANPKPSGMPNVVLVEDKLRAMNSDANNARDPVKERLLSAIAARPSRTRQQGAKRALALYGLAIAAMLGLFEAAGGVAHGIARPSAITMPLVLGSSLIAFAAVRLALGRGRAMTGRSFAVLLAVVVLVPVVAFAWQTHWFGTYTEPFQRFGWRCIGLTVAMGSALLGAVIALRRGTVATSETLHGAAAGAAAGACATVLVDAWCPLANTAHVAQGHMAPIVVLTIMGAVLGRTLLRIRARS